MRAAARGRKGRTRLLRAAGAGLQSRRSLDMPEEAGFPPAKRFRPGCGPPGGRVLMLLTAGGSGGRRRPQPALAQPAAGVYPEAVERQRRSLPIFAARGQLLAQLRALDSAVLIGEWPEGLGGGAPPLPRGAPPAGGPPPTCPAVGRAGDSGSLRAAGGGGRSARGRACGEGVGRPDARSQPLGRPGDSGQGRGLQRPSRDERPEDRADEPAGGGRPGGRGSAGWSRRKKGDRCSR